MPEYMQMSPKHGRSTSAWRRFIVPTTLCILLLLLLICTVLLILGNLGIIYWPAIFNTLFISIVVPDLGIIITLAQWLHTLSEKSNSYEKNIQLSAPIFPITLQNSSNTLGIHDSEH